MVTSDPLDGDPLLTSAEVASVFRVNPRTVTRWANDGRLDAIHTPGGREKRYRESAVREALNNETGGLNGEPHDDEKHQP